MSAPRRAARHEHDDPFGELGSEGDASLPLSIRKESHDAELYEQMFDERTWEMYERILRRRVASPATSAVSSARTASSSGSSVMSEYVELSSRPSSVPREATAAADTARDAVEPDACDADESRAADDEMVFAMDIGSPPQR